MVAAGLSRLPVTLLPGSMAQLLKLADHTDAKGILYSDGTLKISRPRSTLDSFSCIDLSVKFSFFL